MKIHHQALFIKDNTINQMRILLTETWMVISFKRPVAFLLNFKCNYGSYTLYYIEYI